MSDRFLNGYETFEFLLFISKRHNFILQIGCVVNNTSCVCAKSIKKKDETISSWIIWLMIFAKRPKTPNRREPWIIAFKNGPLYFQFLIFTYKKCKIWFLLVCFVEIFMDSKWKARKNWAFPPSRHFSHLDNRFELFSGW